MEQKMVEVEESIDYSDNVKLFDTVFVATGADIVVLKQREVVCAHVLLLPIVYRLHKCKDTTSR